jgi:hypothetical protein
LLDLHIINQDVDEYDRKVNLTVSWDATAHDNPSLLKISDLKNVVFMRLEIGVRLMNCGTELTLNKMVALRVYKRAFDFNKTGGFFSFAKAGPVIPRGTGARYEVFTSLPAIEIDEDVPVESQTESATAQLRQNVASRTSLVQIDKLKQSLALQNAKVTPPNHIRTVAARHRSASNAMTRPNALRRGKTEPAIMVRGQPQSMHAGSNSPSTSSVAFTADLYKRLHLAESASPPDAMVVVEIKAKLKAIEDARIDGFEMIDNKHPPPRHSSVPTVMPPSTGAELHGTSPPRNPFNTPPTNAVKPVATKSDPAMMALFRQKLSSCVAGSELKAVGNLIQGAKETGSVVEDDLQVLRKLYLARANEIKTASACPAAAAGGRVCNYTSVRGTCTHTLSGPDETRFCNLHECAQTKCHDQKPSSDDFCEAHNPEGRAKPADQRTPTRPQALLKGPSPTNGSVLGNIGWDRTTAPLSPETLANAPGKQRSDGSNRDFVVADAWKAAGRVADGGPADDAAGLGADDGNGDGDDARFQARMEGDGFTTPEPPPEELAVLEKEIAEKAAAAFAAAAEKQAAKDANAAAAISDEFAAEEARVAAEFDAAFAAAAEKQAAKDANAAAAISDNSAEGTRVAAELVTKAAEEADAEEAAFAVEADQHAEQERLQAAADADAEAKTTATSVIVAALAVEAAAKVAEVEATKVAAAAAEAVLPETEPVAAAVATTPVDTPPFTHDQAEVQAAEDVATAEGTALDAPFEAAVCAEAGQEEGKSSSDDDDLPPDPELEVVAAAAAHANPTTAKKATKGKEKEKAHRDSPTWPCGHRRMVGCSCAF